MVTCAYCGKNELLPFYCPYCGRRYCVEHRIPETHQCSGVTKLRPILLRQRENELARPTYGRTYGLPMSTKELTHLGAAILVAFLVEGGRIIYIYSLSSWGIRILSTIMLGATTAFLIHEQAHKLVARRYRMWTEFRLDPTGVVISLMTALPFIPFKVLAPGRMVVVGYTTNQDKMGNIATAGILANIGLALSFIVASQWYPILHYAAILNVDLAFLNVLPFGVLDGRRLFDSNRRMWLAVFAATVMLWLYLWAG